MGKYFVKLSPKAEDDLKRLKKSGRKSDINKVDAVFKELSENPREGTGKPEQLKYYSSEVWSRRLNQKDRIVYQIQDFEIRVLVLNILGHYSDK
ncbi:MAG: Txe/YoeB family addiction module toxin [Bergeyella sp.]